MKEMMEDDYALPTENQQIARVLSSRGNNLHEVETAKVEENFLGECGKVLGKPSTTSCFLESLKQHFTASFKF